MKACAATTREPNLIHPLPVSGQEKPLKICDPDLRRESEQPRTVIGVQKLKRRTGEKGNFFSHRQPALAPLGRGGTEELNRNEVKTIETSWLSCIKNSNVRSTFLAFGQSIRHLGHCRKFRVWVRLLACYCLKKGGKLMGGGEHIRRKTVASTTIPLSRNKTCGPKPGFQLFRRACC